MGDDGESVMSTFERIVAVLSDREWHSREELAELTPYPEWWLEELRHEQLEVVEDAERERVRLLQPA
jgi:hypothetical protein